MGLKADIGALSDDSVQAGTLQGQLQVAQASVTGVQAQIDALNTKSTSDSQTVSSDLAALPPGTIVLYVNPDGSTSGYQFATAAPGFTVSPTIVAD